MRKCWTNVWMLLLSSFALTLLLGIDRLSKATCTHGGALLARCPTTVLRLHVDGERSFQTHARRFSFDWGVLSSVSVSFAPSWGCFSPCLRVSKHLGSHPTMESHRFEPPPPTTHHRRQEVEVDAAFPSPTYVEKEGTRVCFSKTPEECPPRR